MRNIVFKSENLDYINVTMDFIDDYLIMINDPTIQDFISNERRVYSYDGEVEWINSTLENNKPTYSIVERSSGNFVGNIGFNSIIDGVATLGICITPCYQDRGYGTEAIKRIVEYGFNELGINEIILDVFSNKSNSFRQHFLNSTFYIKFRASTFFYSERKSLRHNSVELHPVLHCFNLVSNNGVVKVTNDVCSASALWHSIIGSVDNTPFYYVAQIG